MVPFFNSTEFLDQHNIQGKSDFWPIFPITWLLEIFYEKIGQASV